MNSEEDSDPPRHRSRQRHRRCLGDSADLLKKKECELLGITTVTGPVNQRAAIVEVLCHAGRTEKTSPSTRTDRNVLAYGPGQPTAPQLRLDS